MSGHHRADVLVVGGGIAGVGCAAALAGECRVIVLEAEGACGYHATARSAAIHLPGYGGAEIRRLTAMSTGFLETPPRDLGAETFLSARGELLLAGDDEEVAMMTLLANSPDLVELTAAEAAALVPILEPRQIRRASLEPGARDIDVERLLQAWVRTCRRGGGRVETGREVASLNREREGWRVTAGDEIYHATIIVNAAGAWADEVAARAGLGPLGLVPHRRSAALLPAPAGHDVAPWPLFGSVTERWYARPAGGKLMVSPSDEDPVSPHDAFADDLVIAEGLHRYEQAVTVPVTRVERTWAGLRTFAADRVPVLGPDPRETAFFWLAGQGGYGIQTAPALSALAAAQILGKDAATVDDDLIRALSPARLVT